MALWSRRRGGRRLKFIYAPPSGRGRHKMPKPPYSGAPSWQCSVYYFWWEFLRRSQRYRKCCDEGGKGRLSGLYRDFGDVRDPKFDRWWHAHAHIFAEPPASMPYVETQQWTYSDAGDTYCIVVSRELQVSTAVRRARRLIAQQAQKSAGSVKSRADYPVATKPVLRGLYVALRVWDERTRHPSATWVEVADRAGIKAEMSREERAIIADKTSFKADILKKQRRRKEQEAQRHFRIAGQYIENVAKGLFPLYAAR